MARTLAGILADERLRVSAILNSPEGLNNPTAARKLALEHGMGATEARELLSGLPADNPYIAAMDRETIGIAPAGAGTSPFANTPEDRKAARKVELSGVMGGYNRSKGYSR